jgi:hypothetical protein
MTGDLRQVPLSALTLSVQLTAEVAHNFTQSLLSENCNVVFHVHNDCVRLQAPTPQSSKTSGELTTSFKPCSEPISMNLTGQSESAGRLKNAMSRGFYAPGRGMPILHLG